MITLLHTIYSDRGIKLGTLWEDDNFVFTQWNGKLMNPDTVSKWFCALLRRHEPLHVKFHAVRHSSATLALQGGADIKSIAAHLGHSRLSTTNRYLHALGSADKPLADRFDTMFGQTAVQQKSGQA